MLRYLDEVETEAAEIGSINTVINEGNTLTGFNTDGIGALDAMRQAGIRPDGQSVLILGAGGAAHAIAWVLAGRGCPLKLANRTVFRAKQLARSLQEGFGIKPEIIPLSKRALHKAVTQVEVILNASSMGMDGKHNPPIDKKWIRNDYCIFDLVYRPVQTKLLKDAGSIGAMTITGLDMLVNQGACSFTIWTGKKAPIDKMRLAITGKLTLRNDSNR
jgi:shikimate dehydrogenase